jgi:hypothetical protein
LKFGFWCPLCGRACPFCGHILLKLALANPQLLSLLAARSPLIQAQKGAHVVAAGATHQTQAIQAPTIDFVADGFAVLSLSADSKFARGLDGTMVNTAAAIPRQDQWEKLWRIFRHSGAVTIRTAIVTVNTQAYGFEQASADFEQCLAELDLVAPMDDAK